MTMVCVCVVCVWCVYGVCVWCVCMVCVYGVCVWCVCVYGVCVRCMCMCVWGRESKCEKCCVYVCVCERESARDRVDSSDN